MKVKVEVESAELLDHPYFTGVKCAVRSIDCKEARRAKAKALNRIKRAGIIPHGDSLAQHEQAELEASAACLERVEGADEFNGKTPDDFVELARDAGFRRFFEGIRVLAQQVGMAESESREAALGN